MFYLKVNLFSIFLLRNYHNQGKVKVVYIITFFDYQYCGELDYLKPKMSIDLVIKHY